MGQFGLVQTVQDNMNLFSKRQIAGAVKARELYEKLIFPSTSDFRAIVSAGDVPGLDVTIDDVKAVEVIWGQSVLKMKGSTVWRNGKRLMQRSKSPRSSSNSNKIWNWQLIASLSIIIYSSPLPSPKYASSQLPILLAGRRTSFGWP
jgi:hypothetical protein